MIGKVKGDKGVTLASVTVYVIAFLMIVGTISTITTFFYSNLINTSDNSKNMAELTKFNLYFLQDIKKNNNNIMSVAEDKTYISFTSGNVYTFQDNAIYQNKIKICDNINNAQFKVEDSNGKKVVVVLLSIGETMPVTKTTRYVLSGDYSS